MLINHDTLKLNSNKLMSLLSITSVTFQFSLSYGFFVVETLSVSHFHAFASLKLRKNILVSITKVQIEVVL